MINLKNWYKLSVNSVHKKNIIFISYYFPPMGGGGVQRILKFLKFWDYEDHELIAEIPPHVQTFATSSLDPFRVLYFFKKFFEKKSLNNQSKKKESGQFLRKISGIFFIPDSRILWLPFALYQMWKINRKVRMDLIIGTMPPFTTGIIATLAKITLRIPYLLDFRDAWTNNPYLPKISIIHNYLQYRLEKFALKNASGVIFVNPKLQSYYLHRYPLLRKKPTITIRNGFDPDDFSNAMTTVLNGDHKPFKIAVMGTVYSQGNSPFPLLKAVTSLIKSGKLKPEQIRLVFIGKWASNFLKKAQTLEINSILEWINYLPHKKALQMAQNMDALALAVEDDKTGAENITPGRIYEYLYLRKPILAICPIQSDLAWLIRTHHAGKAIAYSDIESIEETLLSWINSHSQLNRGFTFREIEKYHRKFLTEQLMHFTRQVLNNS